MARSDPVDPDLPAFLVCSLISQLHNLSNFDDVFPTFKKNAMRYKINSKSNKYFILDEGVASINRRFNYYDL